MKEAVVGRHQAIVADGQPAEVAEPGEGALNEPAAPVAAQPAAVVVGGPRVVPPRRDDRRDAPALEVPAQGVAVLAPIGDEPGGPALQGHTRQRLAHERALRRGRRVQVCSHRGTRAIDQNHPLRAPAPLRGAGFGAPFSAGAKLPSRTHSSQRSFSRSLKVLSRARHRASSTPLSSHCFEPAPTRRRAAVQPGQLAPRRPGPEDPQNALETPPIVRQGPPSLAAGLDWREHGAHLIPLRVREPSPCHALSLAGSPSPSQALEWVLDITMVEEAEATE